MTDAPRPAWLRALPRLAGGALQIASLGFVVHVIATGLGRVEAGALDARALGLAGVVAFAFGILLLATQVLALRGLLASAIDAPVDRARAAVFLGRTGLAKYLPGNVFHYVGRQLLGRRFGWSQSAILASSLAEIAVTMAAACGFAALALWALDPGAGSGEVTGAEGVALHLPGWLSAWLPDGLPVTALLGPLLVAGVLGPLAAGLGAARLATLPRLGFLAPLGRIAPAAWASGFGWYLGFIALGISAMAAVLALLAGPFGSGALASVALAYAMSYLLGYLTPGAPGGVGIREALLVVLLGPVFGAGLVAIAAVIQRLGYVLAEAALFAWTLRRMPGSLTA